jgi:hypothetical protein
LSKADLEGVTVFNDPSNKREAVQKSGQTTPIAGIRPFATRMILLAVYRGVRYYGIFVLNSMPHLLVILPRPDDPHSPRSQRDCEVYMRARIKPDHSD